MQDRQNVPSRWSWQASFSGRSDMIRDWRKLLPMHCSMYEPVLCTYTVLARGRRISTSGRKRKGRRWPSPSFKYCVGVSKTRPPPTHALSREGKHTHTHTPPPPPLGSPVLALSSSSNIYTPSRQGPLCKGGRRRERRY